VFYVVKLESLLKRQGHDFLYSQMALVFMNGKGEQIFRSFLDQPLERIGFKGPLIPTNGFIFKDFLGRGTTSIVYELLKNNDRYAFKQSRGPSTIENEKKILLD